MSAHHVVIARFCEDVTWLQRLPLGWTHRVIQKGVDLPNLGREASSYAWWIEHHHDQIDPDGTYAFLQGHPFEPHGVRMSHLREVDRFQPLGRDRIEERFSDGWIEGRTLGTEWQHAAPDAWRQWVSSAHAPPDRHEFTIGAQFLVRGRALVARPASWWRYFGAWNHHGYRPWLSERLWSYIMDPDRYPCR